MTPISPPNHLHTLDEQDAARPRSLRRITPIVGYIVLMLLLLYVLYSSQVPFPVSKRKPVKKPWSISQGFFYARTLTAGRRIAPVSNRRTRSGQPTPRRRLARRLVEAVGPAEASCCLA
jgi:hypothetical protein